MMKSDLQRSLSMAEKSYRELGYIADLETFSNSLDHFVRDARRVTWHMKKQYRHATPGFNAWYESVSPGLGERFGHFNELRRKSEHEAPIQAKGLKTTITFAETIHLGHGDHSMDRVGNIDGAKAPVVIGNQAFLESGFRSEVLAECKEYLDELSRLVGEAERLFGNP